MVETECQTLAHYVWSNHHTEPLQFAVQQSRLFMKPNMSLFDFKSNWLETFLTALEAETIAWSISYSIGGIDHC